MCGNAKSVPTFFVFWNLVYKLFCKLHRNCNLSIGNYMETYLVTGGAGFIGSNFVKYIRNKYGNNAFIIVLDALTYAGNLLNINEDLSHDNVVFIKGDIRDAEVVSSIFEKYDVDYVVNFAAESHVDRSISNPKLFLETNILGTHVMLEAARKYWKSDDGHTYKDGKKFLQISTDEVYGSLAKEDSEPRPLNVKDELLRVIGSRKNLKAFGSEFFTEQTNLAPRSPYSSSKASADLIVMAYHETYGLPVNITRCSNNYGPYQFPEKLIPLLINNILEGKKLPVYGKGENVRDWLHVDDHAKGIDAVLHNGRIGEVYNIGGFNEESNINIVKLVIDILSKIMKEEPKYRTLLKNDIDSINEDLIEFVTDRPGHDMRYAIDPTKIAVELGWFPETPFSIGIEKTIRWYLDNNDWVKSVTSGEYQKYYDEMYKNR